jgi:hypothetical protein
VVKPPGSVYRARAQLSMKVRTRDTAEYVTGALE